MMRWIYFVLFTTAMLCLPAGAKHLTKGFRVAKLRVTYPYNPNWETSSHAPLEIFNQPFHYLDKGAQSYVFESADGQYVIKLFRFSQPNNIKTVERLFNACKIAYDELREETGLVYVHLNATDLHLPTIHCRDALRRSYYFPLDQFRFVVQKKGAIMTDVLQQAKGNPEEMHRRIDAFFAFLKKRIDKKIVNQDSHLTRNFGFLGETPIEIDFGCYHRNEDLDPRAEIAKSSRHLRRWMEKQAPEYVSYLDEKADALVF
jgi:hypothetical protein